MSLRPAGKPGVETKDVNFGALVALTGALLMILGVAILITSGLDRFLRRTAVSGEKPHSEMADLHRLPPEPRLQVDAALDLIRMRDVEYVRLNNYAWVNADAGTVRIPIARAMAILTEQGLPARKRTSE